MPFIPNHPLESSDHGPTHWTVTKTWVWNHIRYAHVRDVRPDLQAPMQRRAIACCLDFEDRDGDEWLVREWRRQFEEAARAISTGFAGLPEPVDAFYAPNGPPDYAPALSREELVVVFEAEAGAVMAPCSPTAVPAAALFSRQLITFVQSLAETLKTVHDSGFVLRQVPLTGVTWNPAARCYGVRDWLGVTALGPSNFHPRIGFPALDARWSAPECYDADARLTPATDVYALGKSLLALLGHAPPRQALLDNVHDAVDAVAARVGGRLPERVRRLLLLALHPHPKQRLRDMDQVVGMLYDGPEPPQPPADPPPFEARVKSKPIDLRPAHQPPRHRPAKPRASQPPRATGHADRARSRRNRGPRGNS
jgi:hypothetical protein